jgi:uncharacterized SAM-binding protein YcdF (DUF218 family)
MSALKQFVDTMTAPLSMALVIALLALLFRLMRRIRAARWLAGLAAAMAYLFSVAPVADMLLAPLESRYPPLPEGHPPADFVVVLGSSYSPREGVPPTAALDGAGLARIVEGVRIWRRTPQAQLVVSGGARKGSTPPARGYEILARDLGVPAEHILVIDSALDTKQEAQALAEQLGTRTFLLVTSASHMPRAMEEMRRHGLRPIAAPTEQEVNRSQPYGWRSLLPGAAPLHRSERALHEYLGMLALGVGA